MRKLGRVQSKVLEALIERGEWAYYGPGNDLLSGWIWDTYENTRKVMISLCDRGIVTQSKDKHERREYTSFKPTPDAHLHLRRDFL